MNALEKREKKYGKKEVITFSPVRPYFIYLFTSPKEAWRLVGNILHNFFFLQWRQKFHFTHRPIIYVNTELDDKIPFTPSYVKTYLGFVSYFITPLDFLYKRFGFKTCLPYATRSIRYLKYLYKNASDIYKYCLTTTPRPNYRESAQFRTIHFWDPHYLCVPSLHVAIAAGLYSWYKNLFTEMKDAGLLSEEELARRIEEFRTKGIAIIESVLFVKQHSVNCIPTALYLVTKTMPFFNFPAEDFHEYITHIFESSPELTPELRKEIQAYFSTLYDSLLKESETEQDWRAPLKNWLISHAQKTSQSLKK